MKLLLHIGSPKAGSSFLQTVCARSRSELAAAGIHFSVGTPHDEESMLGGRISAGNALHLARFVAEGQWHRAERWLQRAVVAAEAESCSRILLSSEWLLGSLGDQGRLIEFSKRLRQLGHESPELLLILRHPVGQFISLYKHRAKSGTVGSIDEWSETGYQLPQRLAQIRNQLEASDANLSVRAYGKASGSLEGLFFQDWLGVPVPKSASGLLVNPSLSLSELVLVRHLNAIRPSLVPYLYDRLLAVDPALKSEGPAMQAHAREVATHAVAQHADEWQHWNQLLPESERFDLPEPTGEPGPEPGELTLSSAQLAALTGLLADAARPRFMLRLFWTSRLRPALARIKRIVLPWHSRR